MSKNSSVFQEASEESDFDISQYSHKEVDRYGVLYDLWCNECAFLECKKNVSDDSLEPFFFPFRFHFLFGIL